MGEKGSVCVCVCVGRGGGVGGACARRRGVMVTCVRRGCVMGVRERVSVRRRLWTEEC